MTAVTATGAGAALLVLTTRVPRLLRSALPLALIVILTGCVAVPSGLIVTDRGATDTITEMVRGVPAVPRGSSRPRGALRSVQPQGVVFIGVNVRDEADTAAAFAKTFGIRYESILDVRTGAGQLAFAGQIAPNAVPTTLVLDRQGRVAARIIGKIPARSTLRILIQDTLSEGTGP